jgi:DNA-binding beta-propeller fold protein YncE
MLSANGCQEAVEEVVSGPVFFPPPPNQPRLQFLTSYAGGEAFNVVKPSFLETFVLGDSEISVGKIGQPYGLAIHKGKIYVCDVGHGNIKVLDLNNNTFTIFPSGRSIQRAVNIFIETDGTKYVADSMNGAISVWNPEDKLIAFLGKDLGIKPIDVVVRENHVFLTDANAAQVLVLDKRSGELLQRIGRKVADRKKWGPEEFAMITDITLDDENNIYVGDKLKSRVTVFDSSGKYLRSYGRPGSGLDSLVRAKGMAVDREGRMWVADAGPACAVKVYREDGQLLMLFGTLGTNPGQMYLPADVIIDYENMDLFSDYAVKGAKLEFLVLVTNQYGPHKVSVYGFGTFPEKYSMQGLKSDDQKKPVETQESETNDKTEEVEK